MEILYKSASKNFIVTIAIGERFYRDWRHYVLPSWLMYCEQHKLNLAVIYDDLIDKTDADWKKPTWQKLLIGREF